MRSSSVAVVGFVWLGVAVGVGASGVLAALRPPGPQLILATLTVALLLAGALVGPFRRWAETVDLRAVVALHLTRFVGVYFLMLYGRGELPYAFAVPAGVGDIVVAALALILLVAVRPTGPWGRPLYLGWNALGMLDILGVVATAAVQGVTEPGSMAVLTRLPLNLLVTFLVPLIIASHVGCRAPSRPTSRTAAVRLTRSQLSYPITPKEKPMLTAVQDAPLVAMFKQTFARLTPDTVMPLPELYAPDVVFEDPLHRIEGLAALTAYFARLNAKVESAEFVFGTQVVGESEAAIEWVMTIRTRRPRQTIVVPGVSVLRFAADRITSQRDYFDVGAMLYERLPLFGWMLRRLKRLVG